MKISTKRKQALYDAIHRNIIRLRLDIKSDPRLLSPEHMENELFALEQRIWAEQLKSLE